jgi:hypothetical protein
MYYSVSRQIRRQWVVDAHRAGTLTLYDVVATAKREPLHSKPKTKSATIRGQPNL